MFKVQRKTLIAATLINSLFVLSPAVHAANPIYTILDDPNATGGTFGVGVSNNGQVAGYYNDAGGAHGFIYNGGAYLTLDDPNATLGTYATGVNNSGEATGYYINGNGAHGFLYAGGVYNTIDAANSYFVTNANGSASGTNLNGINDNGQIVGTYTDKGNYAKHGFIYTNGAFSILPNNGVEATSINNLGQVAGNYGFPSQGFIYANGAYASLPVLAVNYIAGLNDSGDTSGNAYQPYGAHPYNYAYVETGNGISIVSGPNGTGAVVGGINNSGQITGYYSDAGKTYGFVTASNPPLNPVPLPAAAWLFGSALAGCIGLNRRKPSLQVVEAF